MSDLIEKIARIQKVAAGIGGLSSTVTPISNFVTKSFNSVDKTLGLGSKSLKPKGLSKIPAIKNVSNANTTTKGLNNSNSGLGSVSKIANYNGDSMSQNRIEEAYNLGAYEAFTKVAMGMPPQMPMQQDPAMMQQDPAMMQQQQQQQQDPAMMQQQQMAAPVAEPMQAVQEDMAAQAQATPEELQQVQNSGLTSGDIASAAKVIQTMAEMKANADMQGMQAVDPAAAGGPAMPPQ